METISSSHFIDKVAEALRKSAIELEELQLQAALGKAEAEDKYEDVKKKFNLFVHDSKHKINLGKAKVDDLHEKFDTLIVQLNLGKAVTIDAFREQKKRLLHAIHDIEVGIRTDETLTRLYAFLLIEFEKFKVQLDVMEERFERGKENAKTSFSKGKEEFESFVEKMKLKFGKEEKPTKWQHFQTEISEAFEHLKQAFVQPN